MTDQSRFMPNTDPFRMGPDKAVFIASWKVGYQQDPGNRKEQQDCVGFAVGESRGKPVLLAVLADGMGGMKNGADFSRIAVSYHCEHFQEMLDQVRTAPGILLSLALRANTEANRIYNEDHPGGTTLISALFTDEYFHILSIGDSRITLFRKAGRTIGYVPLQMNRDHVLGAALDERAWMGYISHDDAEGNIFRHSLTSSIGPRKVRRIDFTDYPTRLLKGDRLMLSSDGIYKTVPEPELAAYMEDDPTRASCRIIQEVKSRDAKDQDNMSVLIVQRV